MAGAPSSWLQELKLAEGHLNAGRLAEAEAVLRQILKADPNQADALNALAALALKAGRLDVATTLQERALAARPNAPLYWSNLGEMQRRAGNFSVAIESCRKAVALRPSFAAGHNTLGSAQADAGDLVSALIKLYRDNAATLTPDPLHSLVYDSHPPAALRIDHLRKATP